MTTTIHILYFAIVTSAINTFEGHAFIPPHPHVLQQVHNTFTDLKKTQTLATITKHILKKGLHTRIPISILCHLPLSARTVGAKLKPNLVQTKILPNPVPSVIRVPPLTIRSANSKLHINKEKKSIDYQNNFSDNKKSLNTDSSPTFFNTSEPDSTHSSKTRSPDYNENVVDLDYLSKAANPADLSESNFKSVTQSSSAYEYKMKKMNTSSSSSSYRNSSSSDVFMNQGSPIPYYIWSQDSINNDYGGERKFTTLSDKMQDYLKMMNVSRSFQSSSQGQEENQPRGLRNVLDDFRESLSQSLLYQNGKSSTPVKSGSQTAKNLNADDESKNLQNTANPADKIWNSASNFAGNVAERAINLADSFVAAVLDPANIRNNPLFRSNNGYQQSGYLPGYLPQYLPNGGSIYESEYRAQFRTPPSQQTVFSNPTPGKTDKSTEMNSEIRSIRQYPLNRPFYQNNYYPQHDQSKSVFNSGRTMELSGKTSNPIEILPSPSFQVELPRSNRQLPPSLNFRLGQPQIQGPLINYEGLKSGGEIVNSALDLAKSIVGGRFSNIAESGVKLGTDIAKTATGNQFNGYQFPLRNNQNQYIPNAAATLTDTKTNPPQKINNNATILNATSGVANPTMNTPSVGFNVPINYEPGTRGQILNLPYMPSGEVNVGINPPAVGLGRILRSPYGSVSYIIPTRQYNPRILDDAGKNKMNPTNLPE